MVIGDHEKMSVKQNPCAYMCIHVISYIPLRILFIHCIVVLTVFRYLGQFKNFDRSIDCGYDQPVIKFIVANCEHCLRLWIIGRAAAAGDFHAETSGGPSSKIAGVPTA